MYRTVVKCDEGERLMTHWPHRIGIGTCGTRMFTMYLTLVLVLALLGTNIHTESYDS